jgi:hypothetical protein
MNRKHTHPLKVAVLVCLVSMMVTASMVLAGWTATVNLSKTASIPKTNWVDIAAVDDDIVVVWASGQIGAGVTIARKQGEQGSWNTITPGPRQQIPSQYVWAPTVAHSGSQATVVWAEGATTGSCGGPHRVVSYNLGGTAKQLVTENHPIYSPATSPRIAVGNTGWHLIFVGSLTENDCKDAKSNLYYSYRASASEEWSVPVVVVTHDQVIGNAVAGEISYPKIATVAGTSSVHIVWEQFRQHRAGITDTSIWMLSGTTQGGTTTWTAPTILSPADQLEAVRPAITSGTDGKAHISWTHKVGETEQFIYYRSLPGGAPIRPYAEAINVTSDFPDYASSSIVARGNTLCITSYGYFGSYGTDYDEIIVGCSRNGGATWQPYINVSESGSSRWFSIFPVASLDPAGRLHFAWTEYRWAQSDYQPIAVFYRNHTEETAGPSTVFLPLVVRAR